MDSGKSGPSSMPSSPSEPTGTPSGAHRPLRRQMWDKLGTFASIGLFILAVIVLYNVFDDLDTQALNAVFASTSRRQLLWAAGLTALSYLMLTGYDALALRQVSQTSIRYGTTALASFTSFAVSFTLGFPLITAATVRYWIYSSTGLGAGSIASLTLIAGLTFWFGMSIVLGGVMLFQPVAAATFTRFPVDMNIGIGMAILSMIFLYVVWSASRPRSWTVKGWTLQLPRLKVTLAQMLLGALDVCAACSVLYVLLPAGHSVPFATMVAAYVFANLLGVVSHAPGGIGVFEATMLVALPGIPKSTLLGSILLYRLFYYLLPFIIAIFMLGLREIWLRSHGMRSVMESRIEGGNKTDHEG